MYISPTVEKLRSIRLTGIADAYNRQLEDAGIWRLSFIARCT